MSVNTLNIMDKVSTTGRQAALAAGAVLSQNYLKPQQISLKSAIDPVTDTDLTSQETIITLIHQTFPDHGFLAEEGRSRRDNVWEGAKGRGPLPPPPHPLPQSHKGLKGPEEAGPEAPPPPEPLQGWEGGLG